MIFHFLNHRCFEVHWVEYFKLHANLYKGMNIIMEAFGKYSESFFFNTTYVVRCHFPTHALVRILIYLVV